MQTDTRAIGIPICGTAIRIGTATPMDVAVWPEGMLAHLFALVGPEKLLGLLAFPESTVFGRGRPIVCFAIRAVPPASMPEMREAAARRVRKRDFLK